MRVLLFALYQLMLSALPVIAHPACENGCQYTTLILTCPVSLLPGECNYDTALDYTRGARADSPFMCGRSGQTTMAATVLAPGPDQYQKIVCVSEPRTAP